MIRSLIVAHDENSLIGAGGKLPWHIPEELEFFQSTTRHDQHAAIVMGRLTYGGLGRSLRGRINIVVSRNGWLPPRHAPDGRGVAFCKANVAAAFSFAESIGANEAFAIGGASVYAEAFPLIDRAYVTRVHRAYSATDGVYLPPGLYARTRTLSRSLYVAVRGNVPAWTAETWEYAK